MKRYLFTLFLMVFGLYLVAEDTPYAGKTMAVIGDSYVANHRRPKAETWHSRVAERLGMSYLNLAGTASTASARVSARAYSTGIPPYPTP